MEIDLDGFKSIQVDTTKNLVTIGGAVTFGEVIPALYSAGKELRKRGSPLKLGTYMTDNRGDH